MLGISIMRMPTILDTIYSHNAHCSCYIYLGNPSYEIQIDNPNTMYLDDDEINAEGIASYFRSIYVCDENGAHRYYGDGISDFLKACEISDEGGYIKIAKSNNCYTTVSYYGKNKITSISIYSNYNYGNTIRVDSYDVTVDASFIANNINYMYYYMNGMSYYLYDKTQIENFLSDFTIDTTNQTTNHYVRLIKDYVDFYIYLTI